MAAVAAGDEDQDSSSDVVTAGSYVTLFISKATQKETNNLSGYHSRSRGTTIGYDACINDSLLLGVNFIKANSRLNFSNNILGDKSKLDSNFYSLYWIYRPQHYNIFVSGINVFGISNISSSAKRSAGQFITSTYKAYSNIMQVMLVSNYKLVKTLSIKPMFGVKYIKIRDASYKEVGAGAYNLSVARTKERVIEAIAGFKLSSTCVLNSKIGVQDNDESRVSITPEIYAFTHKNINSKMPIIQIRSVRDGTLPPASIKRYNLSFNYGIGVSLRAKNVEVGVYYNGYRASKYISHSGNIKLNINL
ncbi:MAG: autotransporter outer membrane beta-barrel domain-containing protein [Rickettsia endosymbiont of Labidopullus appendiculatus]|nr:autotransporter outer membrane beta-barrel domain-containing protein [Rickettsia endosymbiont of Labidopullus appendiculatus]